MLDTNVTGALHLLHLVGRDRRGRGEGRILITGSIAGVIPGPFNAVYNASVAHVAPAQVLAEQHRQMAEPRSAHR